MQTTYPTAAPRQNETQLITALVLTVAAGTTAPKAIAKRLNWTVGCVSGYARLLEGRGVVRLTERNFIISKIELA